MYVPSFDRPNRDAESILPHVEATGCDHVVVLNTPGLFHTFFLGPIVEFEVERSIDVHVLSSMNGVMSVERVGDRSFVLRADRNGWLTNPFAGMLRSPRPPRPGRVYEKGLFKVTLLQMSPQGRDLRAVRFDMNRPLDDPDVLFIQWDGQTFRPIDLAGLHLKQKVTLADTSDVWASMW
jgi:hypothetical protein